MLALQPVSTGSRILITQHRIGNQVNIDNIALSRLADEPDRRRLSPCLSAVRSFRVDQIERGES